jgi:hypothetical protein
MLVSIADPRLGRTGAHE